MIRHSLALVLAAGTLLLLTGIASAKPLLPNPWRSTFSRSIRVRLAPRQAQQVVSRMTIKDASTFGMLPPGVWAKKTGAGSFKARTPFAVVEAKIRVKPDGRGGSVITETSTARSLFPGMALGANMIHGIATSLERAFDQASTRKH